MRCTGESSAHLFATLTYIALDSSPDLLNLPSTFSPVSVQFLAIPQFSLQSTQTSPITFRLALRMATSSPARIPYRIRQYQQHWCSPARRPRLMRQNTTTVLKMPICQAPYLRFVSSTLRFQKLTKKNCQRGLRGYGTSILTAKRFDFPRTRWSSMH